MEGLYTRTDMNEYIRIVNTIEMGYEIRAMLQTYSQNLTMIGDGSMHEGSKQSIHDFRRLLSDHNIELIDRREHLIDSGRRR